MIYKKKKKEGKTLNENKTYVIEKNNSLRIQNRWRKTTEQKSYIYWYE
jgi:hypothetical protein